MAVDRIKELVQEGLRRKLTGDLQGAADVWAEALRMDPTNRRAAEGLGELKLGGIVPAAPARTMTPALGLVVEQPGPGAKDPFAKPSQPYFEPTPSPFVPEGANPLSLPAPTKPNDPPPFGSSPTAVFGGVAASPLAPALTPSPFESNHTMAFGLPGTPGGPPGAAPPVSPTPTPPPFESSHTMAFGLPGTPGGPPGAAQPASPTPPPFESSRTLAFGQPGTPGGPPGAAQPTSPTPTPPPFESSRTAAYGALPPEVPESPRPPAAVPTPPPERPLGLPLTFKKAGFPFDLESPTIDETAKAAAARRPTPLPGTPLPFAQEPFEGAGPSSLAVPVATPVADAVPEPPEDDSSATLVFGGAARAALVPPVVAPPPVGPGAQDDGDPLVGSSQTMDFGSTPLAPAPAQAPMSEPPFASSPTMVMGVKLAGPGLMAPAVLLERGKMPAAFDEPDSPRTRPFGQAAAASLGPLEPSPLGTREASEQPASVAEAADASFDFPAEPASSAPVPPPAAPPAPAPLAPDAPASWSFTPLSLVQPKATPDPLSGAPSPATLPNFTPVSMVRPALTPVPILATPPPEPAQAFTPLSMVKPVDPARLAAPALTPTKLVAPTDPTHGAPALPRPMPPAAPAAEEVDLDIDVEEGASQAARVAPAPAPPPAEDPNDVGALLRKAADRLDLDDYSGAMELVEKVLQLDPSNATAKALRGRCEATLLAMTESKLGDLSRRPKTLMTPDQIVWLNIDHRAGFLLSFIDGTVSLEELFLLSSMPRLETAKILLKLLQEKAIQ